MCFHFPEYRLNYSWSWHCLVLKWLTAILHYNYVCPSWNSKYSFNSSNQKRLIVTSFDDLLLRICICPLVHNAVISLTYPWIWVFQLYRSPRSWRCVYLCIFLSWHIIVSWKTTFNFPTCKRHPAFLQLRNILSAPIILGPSQVVARFPLFGTLVV